MHFDFPSIYFRVFVWKSLGPSDQKLKSPAYSRRNFPGCGGRSGSDTVWSSKSQSEQSCGLERQMKKKALSRNKKPGFHTWNRGNTKITNLTWQPYFFTIYHFDVAASGSVNMDRPIKICHVSACHVSTNSRPVRNFFFKFRILMAVRSKLGKRGPSDQNMPRRNDKL